MVPVPRFDPEKLTSAANETVTVRRVFGEAYEHDGKLVIPVARVSAATGLGLGDGEGGLPSGMAHGMAGRFGHRGWHHGVAAVVEDDEGVVTPLPDEGGDDEEDAAGPSGPGGAGHGGGGGYAAHVKAVGVYVVDEHGVHWRPAVDVNRVILGGQIVLASVLSAFAAAFAVKSVASSLAQAIASRAARG
ncbi:hypothetical protein [Cellulomonas composti]|uniref:Sporulation protein YtfJ n=1 Tax=Cellulomonas composti TaxID=266130 RepID=A0A511J931_9CELL|nr:hypothetical protein [Cellulomonas composti]GEL94213.1 hypothetical protein CCO02nite_08710 [Cellulomonas composti]